MKRLFPPLLLLLGILLGAFTGCSSTTDMIASGLRIELTQVQRTATGAVEVTWRLRNPNVVSYVFSKSSHKLYLDGTAIGTIEEKSPLGVPQLSQAERTATLVPAGEAANRAIDEAVARGTAVYRQDSTLWVLIIDDEFQKIGLNGAGTVPVVAK